MINISILTLFPELYDQFLKKSIIGRAQQKGIIDFDCQSLFSFCQPKQRIDAPTFGHGAGVLLRPELIEHAIDTQEQKRGKAFKIFFSPQGKKLDQRLAREIATKMQDQNHILMLAPRYEGVDARVEQYYADLVLSIGDYVLMGGDLPAMVMLEATLRYVPGVVGKEESVQHESFTGPFVDYPEYTEPVVWKGMEVPEVIRSGHHAQILKWRQRESAKNSVLHHFDWLSTHAMTQEQKKLAAHYIPPHYITLMHSEILLPDEQVGTKVGTTSVTSLDVHDVARSAKTYGLKGYFMVTPLVDQQKIIKKLLDFWHGGVGLSYNPQRAQAVEIVDIVDSLDEVIKKITQKEGKEPILIATSAQTHEHQQTITFHDQEKVWESGRPVLFVLGTGKGLADSVLSRCDYLLVPVEGFSEFNHLSVRSAAAIIFDRWLGINPKK